MRNKLETRLGMFFALCLIVAIIILEMAGVSEYFKPGIHIYADFTSVQELKPGDLVKMAGVEVGRVDKIDLTNEVVRVTMKIKNRSADIRTDSSATIKFTGLMGQNFVSISFGTTNGLPAKDGFAIHAVEAVNLDTLMVKLGEAADGMKKVSKDMSTDNFGSLFGPITGFFGASSNDLTTIVGNLRKASDQLAAGKGTVGKLLFDDTLYSSALAAVTNVQAGVSDLKSLASDARAMIADVNAGKGTLGLLVRDEALYRETTNAMTNIREITQKVNQGQGSIGKLINDDSFYKNAKVSLQKLDTAMEGLEDQGPLTVLGIAVGKLF